MKKLFIRILYTVIGLIVLLFLFLIYLGLFEDAKVSKKEVGPYTLVYKTNIGNYGRTGDIISKVSETLEKEYNIECTKPFAIFFNTTYLHNVIKVDADKLKSQVGCIINQEDQEKIKENFTLNNFDKKLFFVAEFPYRTKFSIMMAANKVYPILIKQIMESNKHDFLMEIYDEDNDKVIYLLPI